MGQSIYTRPEVKLPPTPVSRPSKGTSKSAGSSGESKTTPRPVPAARRSFAQRHSPKQPSPSGTKESAVPHSNSQGSAGSGGGGSSGNGRGNGSFSDVSSTKERHDKSDSQGSREDSLRICKHAR